MMHSNGVIEVPIFKKSLHNGQGDRLPIEQWKKIQGPLDLVLVEGWMLGFQSVENPQPGLEIVN